MSRSTQLASAAESVFGRSKDVDVNCLAAHLVAKDGIANVLDLGDEEQSRCPLLRNRVLNNAASSAPSLPSGRP